MRKILLAYLKYKTLSILKDDLIKYMNGQSDAISRQKMCKERQYNPILDGKEDKFNSKKDSDIKYSYECYLENHHKARAISELIEKIKKEL